MSVYGGSWDVHPMPVYPYQSPDTAQAITYPPIKAEPVVDPIVRVAAMRPEEV